MLLPGPIFSREAITTPGRVQHYIYRTVYVAFLLLIACTAWLFVAGTQVMRNVGDLARFGGLLFQLLAPLQLLVILFFAALTAANAVAQEKDRRTLLLLLMTRLTNGELVLGKTLASLINVLAMLLSGVPVFWLITLLGGVSGRQVGAVFAVTLVAALAAGSLGAILALWREKTFQTLAMTVLGIVLWLAIGEAVNAGLLGASRQGWASAISPLRAVLEAAGPAVTPHAETTLGFSIAGPFLAVGLSLIVLLNACGIALVRVWNPPRGARAGHARRREPGPETGEDGDGQRVGARSPSPVVTKRQSSRQVWDNPVLWRETCTWAYGRKVLIVKVGYLFVAAAAVLGLNQAIATATAEASVALLPAPTLPMALFFLISLVMVNALAVTSITSERDGQALDLLLVTDISPREFVLGKLLGVLWVTREMVLLPLALCGYLWWREGITGENLAFILIGLAVMNVFVAMLGIHCGMSYANSRSAIGISLGVVFFLFLGIGICMAIMVFFSGSFQIQLAPFVAFVLGGGVGLLVALGHRNASKAMHIAAFGLPLATFYAITSFVLRNQELWVFLVSIVAYGFTTAAMMVPAIGAFDIAMGRTKTAEDE